MQALVIVFGLLFIVSVHARVAELFEGCREFFYSKTMPMIWGGKHVDICQTYNNKQYFATLYDKKNHIPIYSAYVFEKGDKHPEMSWCVEPQLVKSSLNKNMMRSDDLVNEGVKLADIEKVQAVYADYQTPLQKYYNRGHLNPKGHHTDNGSKATYTLTNVVPQDKKLNGGAWSGYENELIKNFTECKQVFVLVGSIPSTNPDRWIKRNNKNRVNIPSYLWNAYCCLGNNGRPIKSGGATAENKDSQVVKRTLAELRRFFLDNNRGITELFKNNCQ